MLRLLDILVAFLVIGASGCQTIRKPVSETDVDQALIVRPTPSTPPPETAPSEPRPGFEQEPPKSQNP